MTRLSSPPHFPLLHAVLSLCSGVACSSGTAEREDRPADPERALVLPESNVTLNFEEFELPAAAGGAVCDTFGHTVIAGQYMLQNNVWNDGAVGSQCVVPLWDADGEQAGFLVETDPSISVSDTAPASYPSIVYGWHFGEMYGGYTEAKQLGEIDAVPSLFAVNVPTKGRFNIAYDLWLHPDNPNPSGPTGGLELMIWLTFRSASPIGSRVGWATIDGEEWEVWRGPGGGGAWEVATFRHTEHTNRLDVDLMDFVDAVNEHTDLVLGDEWYLLSVQAGFEIWELEGEMSAAAFSARVE